MSNVNFLLLTLQLPERNVGFLKLSQDEWARIYFCFSQVGVMKCIYQLCDEGFVFEPPRLEALTKLIYGSILPDFDEQEEAQLDDISSLALCGAFDAIADLMDKPQELAWAYYQFMCRSEYSYLLPSKSDGSKDDSVDESSPAYYVHKDPPQAVVFYSKYEAGKLVKIIPNKRLKKKISRSGLPDRSIEPGIWLDGPAAEMLGFLVWNYA